MTLELLHALMFGPRYLLVKQLRETLRDREEIKAFLDNLAIDSLSVTGSFIGNEFLVTLKTSVPVLQKLDIVFQTQQDLDAELKVASIVLNGSTS